MIAGRGCHNHRVQRLCLQQLSIVTVYINACVLSEDRKKIIGCVANGHQSDVRMCVDDSAMGEPHLTDSQECNTYHVQSFALRGLYSSESRHINMEKSH